MEYLSLQVQILQGWCTAGTTRCDGGYDVTIATYSLPDLYLSKMKNALFVALESNGPSCACAVWCPYSLTPTEWTTRANNTSWRKKSLILRFKGRGFGAHCVGAHCVIIIYYYYYCWNFEMSVTLLFKVSILNRKSLQSYSICDFKSFCVHSVRSQAI